MATISGNELVGETLKRIGVDTFFFIMGGPINDALTASLKRGIRGIDVRHEQAAAMSAQAYSRVKNKPGVCFGASGPGTINLTTGVANALIDCCPIVAFGGSSPVKDYGTGTFQEIDQVAIMKPVTKWADRVYEARRIPEMIDIAFRRSIAGKPGPVYLDLPSDVLYERDRGIHRAVARPHEDARPEQAAGRSRADRAGGEAPGEVEPPGRAVRQRRPVVRWRGAAAQMGGSDRHADLHHAAGTRRAARGPSARLPQRALDRDEGGRPLSRRRHAPELRVRAPAAAAHVRHREGDPHRYRPGRDRLEPARGRRHRGRRRDRDAAIARSRVGQGGRRALRRLARAPRRDRGGEAPRSGEGHVHGQGADPSAAPVQGSARLHRPRRDPRRGRPGNPQLRAPVHPDLQPAAPHQFRHLRHHGGRHAVRGRRQGRAARQAGRGAARRRLVRIELHGARHRRAPQPPGHRRHQPERRLDGRPQAGEARARPGLHALRPLCAEPGLPRRAGREAGGHPPGAGAGEAGDQERQARARQRRHGLFRPRQ